MHAYCMRTIVYESHDVIANFMHHMRDTNAHAQLCISGLQQYDKMAGSQAPEVIPPNVISTYSKKIVLLVLRMQYPDSIKVTSGNLDNVLKEINQVSW